MKALEANAEREMPVGEGRGKGVALSTGFNIHHFKAAHLTDEETETQREI